MIATFFLFFFSVYNFFIQRPWSLLHRTARNFICNVLTMRKNIYWICAYSLLLRWALGELRVKNCYADFMCVCVCKCAIFRIDMSLSGLHKFLCKRNFIIRKCNNLIWCTEVFHSTDFKTSQGATNTSLRARITQQWFVKLK